MVQRGNEAHVGATKKTLNHEWTPIHTNNRGGFGMGSLTTKHTDALRRVLARYGRQIVAQGDAKRALGLLAPTPNSPSGAA
jgi:hypothetical protein